MRLTGAKELMFHMWLWLAAYLCYSVTRWLTWLWPRAWCASPDQHPSCHVSLMQLGGSLSRGPAPRPQPWCGKAQIHSSHRWSKCRRCRPPWRTGACPSGSGFWAPDLAEGLMLQTHTPADRVSDISVMNGKPRCNESVILYMITLTVKMQMQLYISTEGELWQIDESLTAAVGGVECEGLHHVVRLQPGLLHSLLHHLDSLHAGHGIKVAVDSDDLGTYRGTCI